MLCWHALESCPHNAEFQCATPIGFLDTTRHDKAMLLKGTVPTTYDATVLRLLQHLAPIRHLQAHFAPSH
jgi:hypothetical protein